MKTFCSRVDPCYKTCTKKQFIHVYIMVLQKYLLYLSFRLKNSNLIIKISNRKQQSHDEVMKWIAGLCHVFSCILSDPPGENAIINTFASAWYQQASLRHYTTPYLSSAHSLWVCVHVRWVVCAQPLGDGVYIGPWLTPSRCSCWQNGCFRHTFSLRLRPVIHT